VARREGTRRVFAVLAVATAIFTTTTIVWQAANSAWSQRAVAELGADRVLAVDADSAAALLAAVRAVDPDGRYAMAVARTPGVRPEDRVVAVDSTRYAQVGRLPDGMPAPADLAPLLRPPAFELPGVVDGPLTIDLSLVTPAEAEPSEAEPSEAEPGPAEQVSVRLTLSTVDGVVHELSLPAGAGIRRTVEAMVAGCGDACRLVSVEAIAPASVPRPVTVEIYGITQPERAVLAGEALADVTHWRATFEAGGTPPAFTAADERLAIVVAGQGTTAKVLPLAAPSPLPVVLAGPVPEPRNRETRVSVLGAGEVPFRTVARVPALPRVGGSGVLMDLEYATRSNDARTEFVDLEVWLTRQAPDTVVAALAEHGVAVRGEASVDALTREFAHHGPGLALRFEYFAVAIVLLIAAGTAVVGSTVDRSSRLAEFVALRAQGLTSRAVRAVGYAGTAVVVGGALLTGLAATLVARVVVQTSPPIFSDDAAPVSAPLGVTLWALLVAVGAALVVIGPAAFAGSMRLVAAVRSRPAPHRGRHGTGKGAAA
jgi:hypothetical protein